MRDLIKTGRYKIYANGYVYTLNNHFKCIVTDEKIYSYLFENPWRSKAKKEILNQLIDGYPASFAFLNEPVPSAIPDDSQREQENIIKAAPPSTRPLMERLEDIRDHSIFDNRLKNQTFAEALIVIITTLKTLSS